jgi:hypothetical protein
LYEAAKARGRDREGERGRDREGAKRRELPARVPPSPRPPLSPSG